MIRKAHLLLLTLCAVITATGSAYSFFNASFLCKPVDSTRFVYLYIAEGILRVGMVNDLPTPRRSSFFVGNKARKANAAIPWQVQVSKGRHNIYGREVRIVEPATGKPIAGWTHGSWQSLHFAGQLLHNSQSGLPISLPTNPTNSRPTLSYVRLPMASLAAMFAIFPVAAYFRGPWRSRRRRLRGECPHCGYSLTGNMSGRCPECGQPCEQQPADPVGPSR